MPTETKGSAHPETKRAKDRSIWDVAREAFENRLIEGDPPPRKAATDDVPDPG